MKRLVHAGLILSYLGVAACTGEGEMDTSAPLDMNDTTTPADPPVEPPEEEVPEEVPEEEVPEEVPEEEVPEEVPEEPSTDQAVNPPATPLEEPSEEPPEIPINNDFQIISIEPSNGSENINLQTTVSMMFNRSLLEASINENTLQWISAGTEEPVDYTWTYDDDSQTLTLSTNQDLSPNNEYFIRISNSLLSEASDMMPASEFRFITSGDLGNTTPREINDCMTEDDIVILELANQYRSSERFCGAQRQPAVAPLSWDCQLTEAAFRHSRDMAENDYFSHTSLDGSTLGERVTRIGYQWRAVGENIAVGYRSPEAVMDAWINDPGHCRNIMSSNFTEIGHGMVERQRRYWTQVFGTPR